MVIGNSSCEEPAESEAREETGSLEKNAKNALLTLLSTTRALRYRNRAGSVCKIVDAVTLKSKKTAE